MFSFAGAEKKEAFAPAFFVSPPPLFIYLLPGRPFFFLTKIYSTEIAGYQNYFYRTFKGKVSIFTAPIDFIATVENLNNAILQVHLEKYGEFSDVWIWLSTYGLPDSQVQDLENRYQQLFNDLFLGDL